MEVKLNRGMVAVVDDADADIVNAYNWNVIKKRNTFHAVAVTGQYKIIAMHRLIMTPWCGKVVDHVNGNGLDNRRENLRVATHQQNARAHRTKKAGRFTSQFRGVWFDSSKTKNKWRAEIRPDAKRKKSLGCFETEVEAAKAYNVAAADMYGEFADLNAV